MNKTKLNKPLIRKMIRRIEKVPESYNQDAFYVEESQAAPCGTVACLAGEAIICSAPTITEGIRRYYSGVYTDPTLLMGLPPAHNLFWHMRGRVA